MKDSILILGAKSDIGIEIAYQFAKTGYSIQLAARKVSSLEPIKEKLKTKYNIDVSLHEFDALDTSNHLKFVNDLPALPSIAISTIGVLGKQIENEKNINNAINEIRSNFEGPISILSILANKFEDRGTGTLVGLSSVAGERGRGKNYFYGSAKAGFTAFLSGLRNRLSKKNIHVLTVIPGYVATKMTKEENLPNFLTAKPDKVALDIFKAIMKKKNIIYTPMIWKIIIMFLKIIPENIFKNNKI